MLSCLRLCSGKMLHLLKNGASYKSGIAKHATVKQTVANHVRTISIENKKQFIYTNISSECTLMD